MRARKTTTATQNDIMRAIGSVEALIDNVNDLQAWRKQIDASRNTENSEVISAFEKQFETLFNRLNKIEAKIKDLDKKVNGKSATASPLKASKLEVNDFDDGDIDVE